MANMKVPAVRLAVVATAAAVVMAPRDIVIPGNYKIAGVVDKVLTSMQAQIKAAEGKSLKDVDGLVKRVISVITSVIKYLIVEPLVALAYLVEKLGRMVFKSAPQMAAQTVAELKAQNDVFQQQLELLEPVMVQIAELRTLVVELNNGVAVEVQVHGEEIKATEADIGVIEDAKINLEEIRAVAVQVSQYVQQALTNPKFTESLQSNADRLLKLQERLVVVTEKNKTVLSTYETKISKLSELMAKYEQLGGKISQTTKQIQIQAQAKIEGLKKQVDSYDIQTATLVH